MYPHIIAEPSLSSTRDSRSLPALFFSLFCHDRVLALHADHAHGMLARVSPLADFFSPSLFQIRLEQTDPTLFWRASLSLFWRFPRCLRELSGRWTDDKQGQGGRAKDLLGDTSQQQALDARSPMGR